MMKTYLLITITLSIQDNIIKLKPSGDIKGYLKNLFLINHIKKKITISRRHA
jgi:hypothetical protein